MKLRIFSITFCLVASTSCFTQTEFERQLNLIIKDSSNRFAGLKGEFKGFFENDSVFISTLNLQGTDSNTVIISNDESVYILDSYLADIARIASDKQGRKLADEWRDRLVNILSNNFEMSKIDSKIYKDQYGWRFDRGFFSIGVAYMPKRKNLDGLVLLNISFAHLRDFK